MRLPLLSRVAAQVWGGGSGIAGEKTPDDPLAQAFGKPSWIHRCMQLLFWIPSDRRSVLVKDVRVFWRDTSQWGQSLLLFGLLAAYIINLKNFSARLNNSFWIHLIAYLNLGACSLNLATLTTRFVFPQFSRKGKRLWIVGMAPIGLNKVIQIKYTLATLVSLILTGALIVLSCYMLRMPVSQMIYFTLVILVMSLSLNGLAMGLGVIYPNFKEDNPSKIVSGFGGTFCLVMSFLYIVGGILCLAIGSPGHSMPPFSKPLWPGVPFACYLFSLVIFPTALGFAGCAIWKFDGWFSRCLEKSTACIKTPWSALQGALLSLSYENGSA